MMSYENLPAGEGTWRYCYEQKKLCKSCTLERAAPGWYCIPELLLQLMYYDKCDNAKRQTPIAVSKHTDTGSRAGSDITMNPQYENSYVPQMNEWTPYHICKGCTLLRSYAISSSMIPLPSLLNEASVAFDSLSCLKAWRCTGPPCQVCHSCPLAMAWPDAHPRTNPTLSAKMRVRCCAMQSHAMPCYPIFCRVSCCGLSRQSRGLVRMHA
eukprot:scaffold454801_cov37-Prasinocladus_malaysianus.AAC.1